MTMINNDNVVSRETSYSRGYFFIGDLLWHNGTYYALHLALRFLFLEELLKSSALHRVKVKLEGQKFMAPNYIVMLWQNKVVFPLILPLRLWTNSFYKLHSLFTSKFQEFAICVMEGERQREFKVGHFLHFILTLRLV